MTEDPFRVLPAGRLCPMRTHSVKRLLDGAWPVPLGLHLGPRAEDGGEVCSWRGLAVCLVGREECRKDGPTYGRGVFAKKAFGLTRLRGRWAL
jgi:hypothetical protein